MRKMPLFAILWLGACVSCVSMSVRGGHVDNGVIISGTVERQLFDMIAATTANPGAHEVGQCIRGRIENGTVIATEVLSPTYMRGTTRTTISRWGCAELPGIVGTAHFHPTSDGTLNDQCDRSSTDLFTHILIRRTPLDIVVCPNGRYHWYLHDGRHGLVRVR